MQAAGQIADLGGGALMAAFGIMAALRERDGSPEHPGSGEGQMVDVSMSDGALSWLAMVAAAYFADGTVPHRGDLPLAGSLICYRPYECADGWVSLGALEPKFWQAWCRGVGREELIAKQFERPGSDAHAQVRRSSRPHARRMGGVCAQARLLLGAGAGARRGARTRSSCASARWWSSSSSRERAAGAPAGNTGQAGTHAGRARPPARAGARRAHRGGAAAAGYSREQVAELLAAGAAAGPPAAAGRARARPAQRAGGRRAREPDERPARAC